MGKVTVLQSDEFRDWLHRLRDSRATCTNSLSHSPNGVRQPRGCKATGRWLGGNENRLWPWLSCLFRAAGSIDHSSALRRRQEYATARHRSSPEIGGDTAAMRTTRFDAADYLATQDAQLEYITAAYETGDPDFIRDAYNLVARARGMTKIAAETGLSRESLYKALGERGNPEFGTMMRINRALGITLSAHPAKSNRRRPRRKSHGATG
jgi:probable addiction module antidote protein